MKYLMSFTGSFVIVCLILSAMYSPDAEHNEKAEAVSQSQATYRLGEENGRVAAFKGDSKKAYFISNTRISDLPMHDAELLRRGITVDDEEKLKELTEEYCS